MKEGLCASRKNKIGGSQAEAICKAHSLSSALKFPADTEHIANSLKICRRLCPARNWEKKVVMGGFAALLFSRRNLSSIFNYTLAPIYIIDVGRGRYFFKGEATTLSA